MQKDGGYIGMIMILLMLLVVLIIWPLEFSPALNIQNTSVNSPPGCPQIITNGELIHLPPADNFSAPPSVSYKKIRANVAVSEIFFDRRNPGSDAGFKNGRPPASVPSGDDATDHGVRFAGTNTDVDITKFQVWYSGSSAKMDLKYLETFGFGTTLNSDRNIFFKDYGLLFLVPTDSQGKPNIVNIGSANKNTYWVTDIYREINKPELPDYIFVCPPDNTSSSAGNSANAGIPGIFFPAQSSSPDKKQLQAEYFVLEQTIFTGNGIGFRPDCKPALYLYPTVKTEVNVKVNVKGSLTYTNPKYPPGGWEVTAYPDGTLSNLQPSTSNPYPYPYPYLYYEAKIPDKLVKIPSDGFVVTFDKLPDLYNTILPKLGLDNKQANDFKDYWQKALPYSPYYFVGIMSQDDINSIEPLEITPKPDSINRVRLYFKAMDKKPTQIIGIPILPVLSSDFRYLKSDFRVVEWGGMVKSNPLEPFTCSQ